MFGKKKKGREGKHIIAIKDFDNTVKAIMESKLSLPYDADIYQDLIATQKDSKLNNLKELNKFIRLHKMAKSEVKHHFEGLLFEGYTLFDVYYDRKDPDITRLCETKGIIKYVCAC